MQEYFEFLIHIDKILYEYIFIYANPDWLESLCHFLVKESTALPFLIAFFVYYTRKYPKKSVVLILSTLILLGLSEITASLLKEFFERHRPVYEMGMYISQGGFSFPSAHALNTMAFAVLWSKKFNSAGPYLFSLSIIIGFSRMISNYHFPADIIGGWITGYILGKLFLYLQGNIETRFFQQRDHESISL